MSSIRASGSSGRPRMVDLATRAPAPPAAPALPGRLRRVADSDLLYSFRRSPVTVASAIVAFIVIASALSASWMARHKPSEPGSLSLLAANDPPAWTADGNWAYPLGPDHQG